jgi:hypothetical protein
LAMLEPTQVEYQSREEITDSDSLVACTINM